MKLVDALTPDNKILKSKGFKEFCRSKYDDNSAERWTHGQRPYKTIQEYLKPQTLNFLLDKYKEKYNL